MAPTRSRRRPANEIGIVEANSSNQACQGWQNYGYGERGLSMRTAKANIHGKEYLICFSTRVLMALEEREGDSSAGLEKSYENAEKVSDVFWSARSG